MYASRREIKSSIVISLMGLVALSIILAIFINSLSELQITKESDIYFALSLIILALIELFSMALLGNIVEYFRKEPELITLSIPAIIVAILAKQLELFKDNVKTAIALGVILGIALYVLVSKE